MDQQTLLKIAKLRTMAARHGKAFDVVRFATDRQFARATLSNLLETSDEQLLVAGLDLLNAMGMTAKEPVEAQQPAVAASPLPAAASSARYVGRLR